MSARKIPLPERPRNYRFALTPLADAMFQLLIFFMLTTSLTPYSLITLKSVSEGEAQEANAQSPGDAPPEQTPEGPQGTIWEIGNATVRVAGQSYGLDQLTLLAEAIGAQDRPEQVILAVGPEARVQDVARALEALETANVSGVQITQEGDI